MFIQICYLILALGSESCLYASSNKYIFSTDHFLINLNCVRFMDALFTSRDFHLHIRAPKVFGKLTAVAFAVAIAAAVATAVAVTVAAVVEFVAVAAVAIEGSFEAYCCSMPRFKSLTFIILNQH